VNEKFLPALVQLRLRGASMVADAQFQTIAGPGVPERTLFDGAGTVRLRPCRLFVRNTVDGTCVHVTLPTSWETAPVGRLLAMLARRWDLPAWDVHLETVRSVLANEQLLYAAIVPRETLLLKHGPAPGWRGDPSTRSQLWVWGRRVDGCISLTPERQPGLFAHRVQQVALGAEHALVVTRDGLALTWGRNDSGQLGTGDEKPRPAPAVVRALSATLCEGAFCGAHCSAVVVAGGRYAVLLRYIYMSMSMSRYIGYPEAVPLPPSVTRQNYTADCKLHPREVAFGNV